MGMAERRAWGLEPEHSASEAQVQALLTTREVAERLRCSVDFVRKLVGRGDLACIRITRFIWRFRPEAVEAQLRAMEAGGGHGQRD